MTSQTLSDAPSGVSTSSPDTLSAQPFGTLTSVEEVRQGGEDIFRHHQITVHNADCMDVMARFPDKYFELAIVDPPYGIGAARDERGGKQHGKAATASKIYGSKTWDDDAPPAAYFAELARVSRNQVVWGANHFIDRMPWPSSCWIVWDKLNGDNGYADCELAWTSYLSAVRRFAFKWQGMLQGDMANKEQRIHPTQKPVALYRWLLANYAKPGWKILDTHGGSLSSAIACHYAGNPLVACELDTDYFKAACARLVRETAQAELPVITQPQHEQTELI